MSPFIIFLLCAFSILGLIFISVGITYNKDAFIGLIPVFIAIAITLLAVFKII